MLDLITSGGTVRAGLVSVLRLPVLLLQPGHVPRGEHLWVDVRPGSVLGRGASRLVRGTSVSARSIRNLVSWPLGRFAFLGHLLDSSQ